MNTGIMVTMIINLVIAIGVYLLSKEMNDKFARLMLFCFIMTPTLGALLSILIRKG